MVTQEEVCSSVPPEEMNHSVKPGIVSGTRGISGTDDLREEAGRQLIKVC